VELQTFGKLHYEYYIMYAFNVRAGYHVEYLKCSLWHLEKYMRHLHQNL